MLWGIATGLGMQWTLGAINIFFLWVLGVPVTYYAALVQGGGLGTVWTWINAPYTGMNLSLIAIFIVKDWQRVQTKIQEREEGEADMHLEAHQNSRVSPGVATETLGLLKGGDPGGKYGGVADQ